MTSNLEIWRAAQATIDRYDDEADIHAAERADELMAEGDMEDRAVWHKIERARQEAAHHQAETRERESRNQDPCAKYGPNCGCPWGYHVKPGNKYMCIPD